MKPLFSLFLIIATSCVVHSAALIGPFDYSSSSQFTSNFYVTHLPSTTPASTLGVTGGQLVNVSIHGGDATSWVYDTTPDGTPTNASFVNFTVSTTFSVSTDSGSLGFYFYNGGNRTSSLQAMISLNSTTNDLIRFWTGSNMNTSAAGTIASSTSLATGFTLNTLYVATLTAQTLSPGNVQATLTISDPNLILADFSASYTFTGVVPTAGEIGFRSYTNVGTNYFDNLVATAIPEPSSTVLLLAGGMMVWTLRRRIRRSI